MLRDKLLFDHPEYKVIYRPIVGFAVVAMIDKATSRSIYVFTCDAAPDFITSNGVCISFWRDDNSAVVQGKTSLLFHECLLYQWGTIVSDVLSRNTRRYWGTRLAVAAQMGLRVGLADIEQREVRWYDPAAPLGEWLDTHINFAEPSTRDIRYVISREKASE